MVSTRRGTKTGGMMLPPAPVLKAVTKAKKAKPTPQELKVVYGATFAKRSKRGGEAEQKINREKNKVARDSKTQAEAEERVKKLARMKKMLQKRVTGAMKPTAEERGKGQKKGPYRVKLSTIEDLEKLIKFTPFDGVKRGKEALKMVQQRLKDAIERRKVIAKMAAQTNEELSNLANYTPSKKVAVQIRRRRITAAKRVARERKQRAEINMLETMKGLEKSPDASALNNS